MQLTIGPPLLFALGIRILINFLNPQHSPTVSDHLLQGLWQGVLLYHTLVHLSDLVYVVGAGIIGKLFLDASQVFDTTKFASTLLGVALGVLVTNILSQMLEDGSFTDPDTKKAAVITPPTRDTHDPSPRRTRRVSFDQRHTTTPHRHRDQRDRDRDRDRERERVQEYRSRHNNRNDHHDSNAYDPALRDLTSPTPTLAYSIDTAPSLSLESVPSSIDPHGKMTPPEREVAILRARASLADSERRRFKEERKWALSMGNKPRANQLAWQVKRYSALMESFHREADAKVVEAARASQNGPLKPAVPFPSSVSNTAPLPIPLRSALVNSQSRTPHPLAGPSIVPDRDRDRDRDRDHDRQRTPLVSVTVGTSSRTRKRSGGSGSTMKPTVHVNGRDAVTIKR